MSRRRSSSPPGSSGGGKRPILKKTRLLPPSLQNAGVKPHPSLEQYLSAPKIINIDPRPGVHPDKSEIIEFQFDTNGGKFSL